MPRFQLANCEVKLAGSDGHTVPKYGVTPAEMAVLSHVHGFGSVFNVEPTGAYEDVDPHELLDRLLMLYPRPEGVKSPVLELFPGIGARLPETIAELRIPAEHLKAATRVSIVPDLPELPEVPEVETAVQEPVEPEPEPKPARKPAKGKKAKTEPKADDAEEPDADAPAAPALFS